MIQPVAETSLIYESAAYVQAAPDPTGQMLYTFRMTSERVDRQGEVVTLDGWDFTSYMTNPVVLNSHQYGDIEAIVGRCVGITRDEQGWNAAIRFNGTEHGRLACALVEEGDLRAVSVGFRPVVVQYPDGTAMRQSRAMARLARTDTGKALVSMEVPPGKAVRHLSKELLEISVVPIPANADAIRLRSLMGAPVITSGTAIAVTKIVAPNWLRQNARQGLEWHAEGLSGEGVTDKTLAEARAMAGGNVSDGKATRMAAWFARHMGDLDAPAAERGHPDYPSPGVVAHALWGGGSRTESERAAGWARSQSGKGDKASLAGKQTMYDPNNLEASGTGEDHLWQSVAHAMYVVLTTGEGDEAVRRRRYNALERLYRTMDREPPAYTTADTAAKMQGDARDLQFWEGEHLLVAAKVGRVVSAANQAKLMTAIAGLEAAEEHIDMVLEALALAEEGVTAVLGTMGVMVAPDETDAVPVPTPEMEAAPMYPAAKGAYDAAGLRDWLGARNEH